MRSLFVDLMCREPEQLRWAAHCLHSKFNAKWHQHERRLVAVQLIGGVASGGRRPKIEPSKLGTALHKSPNLIGNVAYL